MNSLTATIHDVAREAGVSVTTVSSALNGNGRVSESTLRAVRGAAERLGYKPRASARGLVKGRTGNIAVAVTAKHTPVITNPFYAEVVSGVEEELEARDLHLLLTSLKRGNDLVQLAAERRTDGLLVIGVEIEEAVLRRIAAFAPLVLVDRLLPGLNGVASDNRDGMRQATTHLIEAGRTRLGFVYEHRNDPNFLERLEGFRAARAAAGWPDEAPIAVGDGGEDTRRAIHTLVLEHALDGIVCANDAVANLTLEVLRGHGRAVPRDVAVIGFDGLSLDDTLATMRVDRRRLGREGAKMLLDELNAPAVDGRQLIVPTRLQPGRSAP